MEAKDTPVNHDIVNTWKSFLGIIVSNDIDSFKKISAEKIRCFDCVYNTQKEKEEMEEREKNESNWYEKLYREWIYIPINRFCKEDYPIIFTQYLITRLKTGETQFLINKADSFSVLVTTTKPCEVSPNHEGQQHMVIFIKEKNEYKFYEIFTIP